MKFKLQHPITIPKTVDRPETEIKELDLVDRMKTKHAKLIPDDCFSGTGVNPVRFIPAIASMADISVAAAEELDFTDLVKLMEEVMTPFLQDMEPPAGKPKK